LAYAIEKIKHISRGRMLKIIFLSILFLSSLKLVFLEPLGGLLKINNNLKQNQLVAEKIDRLTLPDSIFITGSLDKALFPEKKVIYSLTTDRDFQAIKSLIQNDQSVYWLVTGNDIEGWIETTNQKLSRFDLQISEYQNFQEEWWLVEIVLFPLLSVQ
jgi:hypothetical protein